jgi:hypothetical protein
MSKQAIPSVDDLFYLPFHSVRHISSPEDTDNGRRVYTGHAPITGIVGLPTNENVRDYLLEAEGKKRRRPTQVHKAIRDTLENYSSNFSILNSGLVIVSRHCDIDEKNKRLILTRPSIVNGSQTQGVIKDFLEDLEGSILEDYSSIHIKFELIVTDDEDLIADISIARNFQDDVRPISIAGRLGQLDELEESLQTKQPGIKLQKSETKLSEDYIKTERLLQVITALIPEELWIKEGDFNKVYTYSQKAKCLKDFQEIFTKSHKKDNSDHDKYKELYQFYLDIVAEADDLYKKWKNHQGFQGTGLHAIKRDDSGQITDVPDGIVFPILASLSVFAKKIDNKWRIVCPEQFNDNELIRVAKTVYIEIAKSNPNKMGKTKACYSALLEITSLYKKLTRN